MPSRNVIKVDVEQCYYHVYARGHGKQKIFLDDEDYRVFLNLFKRHLSVHEITDKYSKPYYHLRGQLELLCYCLMENHFHILLYQIEKGAMSRLMRGVMTSYSCYFNKKYDSSGPLFESRYKASMVANESYLMHISRYIHLNPDNWQSYLYSSIGAYFGLSQFEWLQPSKVIDLFGDLTVYVRFLEDYEDYTKSIDDIKYELAGGIL